MSKTKKEWPGWRFPPDGGKGQIFDGPEEVPEGWVADLSDVKPAKAPKAPKAPKEPAAADSLASAEAKAAAAAKLVDDNTQAELVAILVGMNDERADDAQIEYLDNWPKAKLAATIVENTAEETGE